jgi:serine/threonine protein kinase/Flp pilus assembly protein TadD
MGEGPTKTLTVDITGDRTGRTISGKFLIIKEIGRGGMGVVYEAEDLTLKRKVALKFLPPQLTGNPEARERFVHEAQAASSLDHANICTIHEIGETAIGEMYIAMSLYEGESLKDMVARGRLPAPTAMDIAVQVAQGLAKAHEHGIVHRDIKPGNLFVTSDGTVKILDFGLAKLSGQAKWTLPGSTMGTVAYMSPEQVRGEDVDARTDIWSLGVVLYEMAAGGMPFPGDRDQAVFHAILNDPPLPVADVGSGFPAAIEGVIRMALAKNPAKRFRTAREMADALLALKEAAALPRRRRARRLSFGRTRRKVIWTAAASVLILAVISGTIRLLNRPSLAFEKRDKLMVADVDNQTGEKVFDLALRTAIEADLQQSPYVAVFDKPQIAETLRLMRLDPGTKVNEEIGCNLCRFAAVRAFILPRILSAGQAFELEAILIDPIERRHVDRIRVTARGREDVLLHAIDQLGSKVRARLGESLSSIRKADRSVAQVTTSSWEALDYFSLGQARWQEGNFKEAASLMDLALEKDPQFVEARSTLGLLCVQFLGRKDKGREMLREALRDAETQKMPHRDILKLRAANKQFVDQDLPGALEEYRTMRELFPDFMPPWNNSGMILRSLGRFDEAAAMFEKAAELAPRNSIPLSNLWFLKLDFQRDAKAAEGAARRLVALAPGLASWHNSLGYSLAAEGRFEEAEKEFRKATQIDPDHPYALPNLGHVLMAMGRTGEAVPLYRRVYDLAKQGRTSGSADKDGFALALALRLSGQPAEAAGIAADCRAYVVKHQEDRSPAGQTIILGLLAAAGGETEAAAVFLKRALAAGEKDPYELMNLAELEAVLGRKSEAIATVKRSLAAGYFDYFFPVILPGFQSIRNDPAFKALFKLD